MTRGSIQGGGGGGGGVVILHYDNGFSRAPEIDLRYEIKARKVMVDFKFDALYS